MFGFLPAVLVCYFLFDKRFSNYLLLAFSLIFYAWGEPVYVFLMIFSICTNWVCAMGISHAFGRKRLGTHTPPQKANSRVWLIVGLVINLAILGFFKYEGFLADNINALVGSDIVPNLHLPLPIGISFFTLQAVSYIIDVYWGNAKVQRNIMYLGMYIAMFPQLVAGPIVRYVDIEHEIDNRKITLDGFVNGLRLFCVGLGKKVLIANIVAIPATLLLTQSPEAIGFIGCSTAVIFYTFQIYFDFGGYSDMAIGLGKMFGFDYKRNFNYPYISKSVTEFWRRWHISLSSFFRDYVYIPLGGNRVSSLRWMLNMMIVWGLTGMWHGAAWNFIGWGLYYGLVLIGEKKLWGKALAKAPSLVQHAYGIISFLIGWTFFAVEGDFAHLASWFAGLFGAFGFLGTSTLWELTSWEYLSFMPICIIAATPIVPWLRKKVECKLENLPGSTVVAAPEKNPGVPPCALVLSNNLSPAAKRYAVAITVAVDVCLALVLVASIASIAAGAYNPFIYFQF